jgi:hypothetical protein
LLGYTKKAPLYLRNRVASIWILKFVEIGGGMRANGCPFTDMEKVKISPSDIFQFFDI